MSRAKFRHVLRLAACTVLMSAPGPAWGGDFLLEDYLRLCEEGVSRRILKANLGKIQAGLAAYRLSEDTALLVNLLYATRSGTLHRATGEPYGTLFSDGGLDWSPEFSQAMARYPRTRALLDSMTLMEGPKVSERGLDIPLRFLGVTAGLGAILLTAAHVPGASPAMTTAILGLSAVSLVSISIANAGDDGGETRRKRRFTKLTVQAIFLYNGHALVEGLRGMDWKPPLASD